MRPLSIALAASLSVFLTTGCGSGSTQPAAAVRPSPPPAAAGDADPETAQAVREGMSRVINDASLRYLPLVYRYDEELLKILDQVEAHLSGRSDGPAPRFMAGEGKRPGMTEEEELDHFRETIRRWQAKTGKDLRKEIDPLKAEVAERKPGGPRYHPEFHKRFSAAFDDFIPVEVAEIRERRNRYIHEHIRPLFDLYRAKAPAFIKAQEEILNQPPYNLLEGRPATTPVTKGDPGKG